jgi:hypothetical protein
MQQHLHKSYRSRALGDALSASKCFNHAVEALDATYRKTFPYSDCRSVTFYPQRRWSSLRYEGGRSAHFALAGFHTSYLALTSAGNLGML